MIAAAACTVVVAAAVASAPHGYLTSCSEKTQTTRAATLW